MGFTGGEGNGGAALAKVDHAQRRHLAWCVALGVPAVVAQPAVLTPPPALDVACVEQRARMGFAGDEGDGTRRGTVGLASRSTFLHSPRPNVPTLNDEAELKAHRCGVSDAPHIGAHALPLAAVREPHLEPALCARVAITCQAQLPDPCSVRLDARKRRWRRPGRRWRQRSEPRVRQFR